MVKFEKRGNMVFALFEPGEPTVVFERGEGVKERIMEQARQTGLWNCGTASEYGFCAICTEQMIDDLRGRVFEEFFILCPRCAEALKSAKGKTLAAEAREMYCQAARPPTLEFVQDENNKEDEE